MIFRQARKQSPTYEKARSRFERLQTFDVLNWVDQAGSGLARALQDYRRDGLGDSLREAQMGAEAILAAIELLQERHEV